MTSWRHKTLSASAIRKQVSRCCIHFPHELTCQILTSQSIKIRRRAWSTLRNGAKSQKRLLSLHVKAGWIFASATPRWVWNQNFNGAAHEHNLFNMHLKKIILEPATIWKVETCQRIISKSTRTQTRYTWARDTVRRYWSADTLFLQLSTDRNMDGHMDVQYQAAGSQTS